MTSITAAPSDTRVPYMLTYNTVGMLYRDENTRASRTKVV